MTKEEFLEKTPLCRDLVTRGEWLKFCKATGLKDESLRQQDPDDRPVVGITWDEATAYARWACARLPTEAELKEAERFLLAEYSETDWNKWPLDDMPPVGRVGETIRDLHGIVFQWCSDAA